MSNDIETYLVSLPLVDWRGISPFSSLFDDATKIKQDDVISFSERLVEAFPETDAERILENFAFTFSIRCFVDTEIELANKNIGTLLVIGIGKRNDCVFLMSATLPEYKTLIVTALFNKEGSHDYMLIMNGLHTIINTMHSELFKEYKKIQSKQDYFLLGKI